MYLSSLRISNFRSIKRTELLFKRGVNVIIGENNAGKSSVIDALRIGLGYGKWDNTLSVRETDLHINRNDPNEVNREIQFDFVFEIEHQRERDCFYDLISQHPMDKSRQTIQLHLKFIRQTKGRSEFFRRVVWGGDNEGQHVPIEAMEEIFFVYLDPLRDAVKSLKPYSYDNKVGKLFNELTRYEKGEEEHALNEKKKTQLATELYKIFEAEDSDWSSILNTGNSKVNDHLKGTGISSKYPEIKMNYLGREYSDVVRGIELKRPIYREKPNIRQKYFEIPQNGLGENNLIYSSVVLGDLVNRCEDSSLEMYNALLVEEPEAHLHPQYQNTFFSYLNELQNTGVQIFITSHSPTIAAKSNIDNIIVLQNQKDTVSSFSFSELSESDFSLKNKNHLRKFLDASKSQMLFANGVILVEGIAEALLIPVLSRKFLGIDLVQNGIEIVNINGIAFEHFAKLFNNSDEGKRLSSRCSIITDSDPSEDQEKSNRARNAEGYRGGNLEVCLAKNSLEYDLFLSGETNKKVIRFIYRGMHLKTPDLKGDFDVDTFWKKLNGFKDKGDFALELQGQLEDVVNFKVPEYIEKAILWVTNKTENV